MQIRPERTAQPGSKPAPRSDERRSVRLAVVGIRPLTVFRIWIVMATLGLLVTLVAVFAVYSVLSASGVLHSIEKAVNSGGIGHHFRFSLSWILTKTAQIGLAVVAVSAALAACVTAVFNAIADVLGGVEITVVARSAPEAAESGNGHVRTRSAA
jgi:hypothetical protein